MSASQNGDTHAGTANLSVVISAGAIAALGSHLTAYALPLYFPARALAEAAWETYVFYSMLSWLFASTLAGLAASRIGERRVWAVGLALSAALAAWLIFLPLGHVRPLAAVAVGGLMAGVANGFGWVGSVSLVQRVPRARKGLANGLFLATFGVAGIVAPVMGRTLIAWSARGEAPAGRDFMPLLVGHGILSLVAGALVILRAERSAGGRDERSEPGGTQRASLSASLRLLRSQHYLALGIPLGVCSGAVFAATNAYRAYRAAAPGIALRVGAEDHGWAALMVLAFAMQLVGSVVISRLAGKKASYYVVALLLAGFALMSIGSGWAPTAIAFCIFSGLFEIMRQVARWMETGFISEHMPEEQRAASIGFTATLSSLGAWGFLAVMRLIQSPDSPGFSTSLPFHLAGAVGLTGAAILLVSGFVSSRNRARTKNDGGNCDD